MYVRGTFDNGLVAWRKWSLKGESVKSEKDIPPDIEAAAELEVMMNPEKYLGLSDQERVNYVYGMVALDPGKWSSNQILSNLSTNLSDLLPDDAYPTKEQTAAHDKLVAAITKAADAAVEDGGPQTPQQFLATAVEAVTTFGKSAKEYVARMSGTVAGIASIKAAEAAAAVATLPEIDSKRATLSAKRDAAVNSRAEITVTLKDEDEDTDEA